MAATVAADFNFEPKVWSRHSAAYRDDLLVLGAWAVRNNTLKGEGTGVRVNFPYYGKIGPVETPAEDQSLTTDNLTDNSFATDVREAAKQVGITDSALMHTADSKAGAVNEMLRQLGRVHAEHLDNQLLAEISSYDGDSSSTYDLDTEEFQNHEIGDDESKFDNLTIGFKSAGANDTTTARTFLKAKTLAFGDKSKDTAVCFMHPLQLLDLMEDTTAGFLKADANDPYSYLQGFTGRLFGAVIVESEKVPKLSVQIGNKDAYLAHFHKINAYGIIEKAEIKIEADRDISARKAIWASSQWYGVKSFDRKISRLDNKSGGMITVVNESLKGARA